MAWQRLNFFVGKGGVGKSSVAGAFALASAHGGQRTLMVEFGSAAGLARLFGKQDASSGTVVEVEPGLYLQSLDGRAALAEYLGLVVPIRRLLKTVLDSSIYRSFVDAAPGLKELMTMGKVWYEVDKKDEAGRLVWDRVVVDCGASGQSLEYLSMPATGVATFSSGLVHRESRRIDQLIRDPAQTAVHVVTVAEEMPLTEAAEVVAKLKGPLGLPLGRVFANRCRGSVPPGVTDGLARLADMDVDAAGVVDGISESCRQALLWQDLQEEGLGRFTTSTGVSVFRLPLLGSQKFGRAQLSELAAVIDAAGDGAAP
ncbi:MAG: ArsA family ATPase [Deltaproteobacteria bacterium]